MSNTKMLAQGIGIMAILLAWGILHAKFWLWLLGSETLWSLAAMMATACIIPAFAWALWADLREGQP